MAARNAARKKAAARKPPKRKASATASGRSADNQRGSTKSKRGAHLEPYKWVPGQSGNPKGRPKGKTLEETIRARLMEESPDNPGKIRLDDMAETILREVIVHADSKITTATMDRLWPKVDKVEHNHTFGARMDQIRAAVLGGEE